MAGLLKRLTVTKIIDPLVEQIACRLIDKIRSAAPVPVGLKSPEPILQLKEVNGAPQARDYVLWAYRLLLGREPEDPENLESHIYARDRRRLVEEFLNSAEFRLGEYRIDNEPPILPEAVKYFLTELADGLRFWVNLRDEHVSRGIIAGMWEPTETAFVSRQVKTGMSVIDIGANLGWFTVHMSRQVGPSGRVTAFEPRCDIHHYLAQTVSENRLDNVVLHNCALGARTGDGNIYWAKSDLNPGGTQLVPHALDPDVLPADHTFQPVSMRVLDQVVLGRVDFIKIDVEGAERLVFEGAGRILSTQRPVIMSELSPEGLEWISGISAVEYLQFFEERGYTAHAIEPDGRTGYIIPPEALEGDRNLTNIALFPSEANGSA